MAIKEVVIYGDERLRQPSREIHKVSSKIQKIVDDLYDTMYSRKGVGLAAPQIGENYRVFVIDTAVDNQPPNPITFINPVIVKKSGAISSFEGCLSFPDVYIKVRRYANVIVRAKDIKGRIFTYEAKDGSLIAKALQHENDHLNGIVFIDHSRNRFEVDKMLAEKGLPPIDPKYLLDEQELEAAIVEWEKLHPPTPEEEQVLD